ncbi:hypothetical protein D3C75_753410 [compost metagenome]
MDRLEVVEQAFLIRAVVVTGHMQGGIRPHLLGETGVFDGFDRVVGARTGDDRDPSRHLLDHQLHHPAMLVVGQGRALPRGTDRHYAMGPLLYVPLHQASQCGLVQLALSKWGDQGNYRTLKHGISFS